MANGRHKFIKIAVEGNIGCGKTTLLNHFKQFENIEIHFEPVWKWRNVQGINGLALMYQDPSRWSMALQSYVQLTMLQVHEQPQVKQVKMMERSLHSSRYCFIENLYKRNSMSHFEYSILDAWFQHFVTTAKCHIDLIVYLRTTPELLHRRILQRCRPEETTIPLEYLQGLHELHEDWLIRGNDFIKPAHVLVIDADRSAKEVQAEYEAKQTVVLNELQYCST